MDTIHRQMVGFSRVRVSVNIGLGLVSVVQIFRRTTNLTVCLGYRLSQFMHSWICNITGNTGLFSVTNPNHNPITINMSMH